MVETFEHSSIVSAAILSRVVQAISENFRSEKIISFNWAHSNDVRFFLFRVANCVKNSCDIRSIRDYSRSLQWYDALQRCLMKLAIHCLHLYPYHSSVASFVPPSTPVALLLKILTSTFLEGTFRRRAYVLLDTQPASKAAQIPHCPWWRQKYVMDLCFFSSRSANCSGRPQRLQLIRSDFTTTRTDKPGPGKGWRFCEVRWQAKTSPTISDLFFEEGQERFNDFKSKSFHRLDSHHAPKHCVEFSHHADGFSMSAQYWFRLHDQSWFLALGCVG